MEKVNIPIYRAKKIDSAEYVVSATIREDYKNDWKEKTSGEWEDNKRDFLDMWVGKEKKWTEIDETTLAIHSPDMLDSQGNNIFASLSEDGKGGDIVEKEIIGYAHNKPELFVSFMINGNTYAKYSKDDKELLFNLITSQARENKCKLKVIGIQK